MRISDWSSDVCSSDLLGYAANLVRAELGQPPLPIAGYRPVASAGARGLLGMALQITPEHADFPVRRDRFLELYRANLSRSSKLFDGMDRSEEHTSELQSLMRISYSVFCLKKKKQQKKK